MKKIIIGIVGVGIIICGIFLVTKRKKKVENIEIQPIRGSIAIEFRLAGSVQPRNRLEIKPQVSGRIEDILVVEGQKIKKGEIIAWMSSTERAALLDAVRTKGRKEIKKWQDIYKPTPLIAPIDGFIIARNKEPGQTVTMSDVILVMADRLIIEANVDETDLRHISLKQKVKIFLDPYPDKSFYGHVEHIAYESQVVSNVTVYKVKILPKKVPKIFRSGMTATIEATANKKENVLLLPADAIIEKNAKKFVKVKSQESKSELKKVETGINNGREIEIISGISEDDIILLPETGKKDNRYMRRFGIPGMRRRR